MSRLIDADELIKAIRTDIMGGLNYEHFIRIAPTVDAVPVVWCKECRHKYPYNNVWICRFGLMMPSPDGFCSYGEKVTE